MSNNSVKQFFKPSATKVVLTILFHFLPILAVFITDGNQPINTLINQIPLILLAPHALFTSLIFPIKPGLGVIPLETVFFALIIGVIYYYLLTCVLAYLGRCLKNAVWRKNKAVGP